MANLFSSVIVTAAGRPELISEEVEVKMMEKVSVESNELILIFDSGTLLLTNFRIIHLHINADRSYCAFALNLDKVKLVEDCTRTFSRTKRLRLELTVKQSIHLRFHAGGKDEMRSRIVTALERKSWVQNLPSVSLSTAPSEEKKEEFSTRNAGISGIMNKREREHKQVESLAKESLDDIDSLMQRARDVVKIIKKYAEYSQRKSESKQVDGVSETASEMNEAAEMEDILRNIGIVSPVTRLSAGRFYHQQLARQIADLLLNHGRLERLGGVATLTDIYCLYNRARGTELVSPEDMLQAAMKMEELGLGIRLHSYSSGVLALQLRTFDENAMRNRILALSKTRSDRGIHASDVAEFLNISVIVAKEFLLTAEAKGDLCRDESINGIFFYENIFLTLSSL